MSREELINAVREIARVITAEINQPGDNDHRFRALKRAEAMALATIEKAEGI
jgi:hypothetical protein